MRRGFEGSKESVLFLEKTIKIDDIEGRNIHLQTKRKKKRKSISNSSTLRSPLENSKKGSKNS